MKLFIIERKKNTKRKEKESFFFQNKYRNLHVTSSAFISVSPTYEHVGVSADLL